jgi:hypothetical protein
MMARWLSDREEARERRLLASQPESSGKLTEFLERLGARAAKAVKEDEQVGGRLGEDRHEVLAVDYREDKPEEGAAARRAAEVAIYDYDRDILVVAALDLYSGEVFEVSEREGAAPPIAAAEFASTVELVGELPGIGDVVRREDADVVAFPAPSYAFDGNPRRARHRGCMLYVTGPRDEVLGATVDLSAREVVPDDELPDILRPDRMSASGS